MTNKFVCSLIFAVIVAIFALQNAVDVTVKFLFAEFTISQALIILISTVIGAVIVLLLGMVKQIKVNKQIKDLIKENDKFKEENQRLEEQIQKNNKIEPENINEEIPNQEKINENFKNQEQDQKNDVDDKSKI